MFNIKLHNNEYISNYIRDNKLWERITSEVLMETLKLHPNSRLIDIGANIGYFSLLSASLGYPVTAFEPVYENLSLIKESVLDNKFQDLITVHDIGISDSTGELEFHISKNNMGLCSTLELIPSDLTSSQIAKVMTLDSFELWKTGEQLIIKIDVEHMETSVLRGMRKTLKSPNVSHVILEVSLYDEELFNIFFDEGYHKILHIGYEWDEYPKLDFDTHYLDEEKYYTSLISFQKQMIDNQNSNNQQRMVMFIK